MSERFALKELCRYNIGTFADLVCRNAILHQDKDAFIWGSDRITFGQFNGRVNSSDTRLIFTGFGKGRRHWCFVLELSGVF